MKIKIVLGKTVYHVYSVYAAQVGRPTHEKDAFFEELEDELATVPDQGRINGGAFGAHAPPLGLKKTYNINALRQATMGV